MTRPINSNTSFGAASQAAGPLKGRVRAPGDKSISHRAIILGALASGDTRVTGLLEGADILSTIGAMQALGANVRQAGNTWIVTGCGQAGLSTPTVNVDCGNAGTGVRLIMGAACAYAMRATFTGDKSLQSRPMGRVIKPLSLMGVTSDAQAGDRLPATLTSKGKLQSIDYTPKQASAQVKSAILLAGLRSEGTTIVRETRLSRDHTENMLRAFGADVTSEPWGEGQIVSLQGPAQLSAVDIDVPGDPSSAAFPVVAALIIPGSDIVVENVMMNPTRTGVFETLVEMGANLTAENMRLSGGEVIADLHVQYSDLVGVTVPPERAPSMIDEYPVLAVAAAFAAGTTHMPGIGELRVKESDRIAATAALLRNNGADVSETEDSLTVIGGSATGGALVTTHHDHRIAMSALILGLRTIAPVYIDDAEMIATSFPDFFQMMQSLGADIQENP